MKLYDQDFYRWTQEQAALLKSGLLSQLDVENLIEEIEAMGRTQKKELRSRFVILLSHLLKSQFQAAKKTRSLFKTIAAQRTEIELLLYDNPSLKPELSSAIETAYRLAVKQAATETGLKPDIFPAGCPYSMQQIMGEENDA